MIENSLTREQQVAVLKEPSEILYGNLDRALQAGDFETVQLARDEVVDLRLWRTAADASPFPEFYNFFEVATRLNMTTMASQEKAQLRQEVSDRLFPIASALSPRVRDLYTSLIAELSGHATTTTFPITESQIAALKESGDLAVLQNPSISWSIKLNRMQTRVERELLGRKALDKRDRELTNENQKLPDNQNFVPPPETDESKPSMDETERLKEGEEAQAIWAIAPAYGGYYKQQSFDTWDSERNTWKQNKYVYESDSLPVKNHKDGNLVISAQIPFGQRTRIPTPYTHNVHLATEKGKLAESGIPQNFKIEKDQNNDYTILIQGTPGNSEDIEIELALADYKPLYGERPKQLLNMPATFSAETTAAIEEIKAKKHTNLGRARALRIYAMRHLDYSNDSSYNAVYENHPNGYIAAIDEFRKADCDVANTYFAALCTKLGIPVRLVTGHMVKGKDNQGNARITSGTGHAWSEIWDGENIWIRIDATPPGDPQQEEEEQKEQKYTPGDYGEGTEALMPSDIELAELEEKLSTLAENLSYSAEERQLAEATGVSPKEARAIVKEIKEAEQIRLPGGERVVDVMSQLFSLIIESRKVTALEYSGPVRKREGGENIEDIVAHKIGILAGDNDPVSRKKEDENIENNLVFDGFDIYFIGDKSGSMSQTVDGETKWSLQRKAEYLILSSLYRFEQNLQKLHVRLPSPLSVRTEAISFRGSDTIDVDKPLSNEFSAHDKVRLWKSLGNQGIGNGDVAALQSIHTEIEEELEEKGVEVDNRLRVVMACSDGMPDDTAGVHKMAEALGKLNSVVVGVGLTETASQVPIIFDTEFSRGDIARDIIDLPAIVARHVVLEAIKLFPDKAKPLYQKQIEQTLAKFERVGVA